MRHNLWLPDIAFCIDSTPEREEIVPVAGSTIKSRKSVPPAIL